MSAEGNEGAQAGPQAPSSADAWNWETLYVELAPRLLALGARRYGLSRDDCEDALQRAVLSISMTSPVVRSREAYLTTCFTRECSRIASRRSARRELPLEAAEGHASDPSERIAASCLFNRGMHLIPPPCRGLISAWAVEGYSVRAAAGRSSLSTATAYKRLARCLKKLTDAIT